MVRLLKAVENIERYTGFSLWFTTPTNCTFKRQDGDNTGYVYITSRGDFEPFSSFSSMIQEKPLGLNVTDLVYFVDFIDVFMEDIGKGGAGWKAFCQRLNT